MTSSVKSLERPEIVKVQLPLSGTHPEPLALLYNRRRNREVLVPVAEVAKHVGGAAKSFWWARWDKRANAYRLGFEAPWQTW